MNGTESRTKEHGQGHEDPFMKAKKISFCWSSSDEDMNQVLSVYLWYFVRNKCVCTRV